MIRTFIRTLSLFLLCFCSVAHEGKTQTVLNNTVGAPKWSTNPFDLKVFIENKGQFDTKDNLSDFKIFYGVEDHDAKIYFTTKGLTWRFDKIEVPAQNAEIEAESEAEQEETLLKQIIKKTYTLQIEFLNSNPDVQIIAEDLAPGYYNYANSENPSGKGIYYAHAYKKLIYKDIYPNIDIEYTFHKEQGIKYALILHPGADVSKVHMRYNGAENIFIDNDGNMHFTTGIGDIIDHAPQTFYADDISPLTSSFQLKGNTVSFQVQHYDNTKEVVVDPWTAAPNYISSNVKSYYIKTDIRGNVYVYGGDDPLRLFKYSSTGIIIWTYTSTYNISGGLAVDSGGNCYITGSLSPGNTTRITNQGVKDTSYAGYGGSECWVMGISTDNATAYMAGGPPVGIQAIHVATGDTTNSVRPLFPSSSPREIRALTVGPDNNIYLLTNAGDLAAVDPSLNIIYINTGVTLTYYGPAYSSTLYGTGSGNTFFHAGVNGIAVDKNYVYFTDGWRLFKANIATGTSIASAFITGGQYNKDAGIAVDGCGNIYVGALGTSGVAGKVCKYDSTLTFVASINTSGAVYDVCLGSGGDILAAGNGFIASLDFVSPACPPYTVFDTTSALPPVANYTVSDSAFCAGDCISLTNLSQNASSYQWVFPGGTPTSSTAANPQNICYYTPGNYSLKLFAYNSGGKDSLVLPGYIKVNAAPPTPSVSQSHDTLICTTDSSYTGYQWYADTVLIPGATTAHLIITSGGNYNVQVTNGSGCSVAVGINVLLDEIQSFTSFNMQIKINPNPVGESFTVYGLQFTIGTVLQVYNVLGQKVFPNSLSFSNGRDKAFLDVANLPSGIYFIQITNRNKNLVGKFVKE